MDDTLKVLRVVKWLDRRLIVPDKVVVEFQSARLLLADHQVSDLGHHLINLAVLRVERPSALNAARALVSLDDCKELLD